VRGTRLTDCPNPKTLELLTSIGISSGKFFAQNKRCLLVEDWLGEVGSYVGANVGEAIRLVRRRYVGNQREAHGTIGRDIAQLGDRVLGGLYAENAPNSGMGIELCHR
jgi:hypothetical protein